MAKAILGLLDAKLLVIAVFIVRDTQLVIAVQTVDILIKPKVQRNLVSNRLEEDILISALNRSEARDIKLPKLPAVMGIAFPNRVKL